MITYSHNKELYFIPDPNLVKKDQTKRVTPTIQTKKPKKETIKSLTQTMLKKTMPNKVVKPLLPTQLSMQEWENKDYEVLSKVPDAIPNLAKYCLENSLPEPIFQTNDFGIYQEVIARVGKLEFVANGELQNAAYGLLKKIQTLEWEELDLIRSEARFSNTAGILYLLILVFSNSFDFVIDYIFKTTYYISNSSHSFTNSVTTKL